VIRHAGGALLVLALAVRLPAQAPPPLEHFTVRADGHPLALWARRPQAPIGTILLVHGRTWSALPDFDLQVPGESRSVLAALAARGYAAYAIDLRGYGATPRDPSGWITPNRAADDVTIALAWIAAHQPMSHPPALLGWSLGSMVAELAAQRAPQGISRLILYGYPADPADTIGPDPDTSRTPAPRHRNGRDAAASDFISPAVTSPAMVRAYVKAALKSDPVLAAWRFDDQWNALDARRLTMPTLLLQGEHDPEPEAALQRLFQQIGTTHKAWVTLVGGDHAALLEDTRPTFIAAVARFLARE
jgi:alpha-beta hydrolase superfamily lysophospholipase